MRNPDSLTPWGIALMLWSHRTLALQMIRRDIASKYKGSSVGVLWAVLNPLFMLAVYAFVFTEVFKARWGVSVNESRAQFALVLFTGLSVHAFVAECITRAPRLVIDHSNYVKRVVFPLEILPVISAGSALFHLATSMLVLMVGLVFFNGLLPATAWALPLVLFPVVVGMTGVGWLLASLGVFVRDVQQVIGMVVTALWFLGPIFFPLEAAPERFRGWLYLNPLTTVVEQVRGVLIWGRLPDGIHWLSSYCCAALVAWLGYVWFQKTRKGFADVL